MALAHPVLCELHDREGDGDQAGVDQAMSDFGGYAVSFGQLINSVVPELPAEAAEAELGMHASSLIAAIDANIAGDPSYFDLLKEPRATCR